MYFNSKIIAYTVKISVFLLCIGVLFSACSAGNSSVFKVTDYVKCNSTYGNHMFLSDETVLKNDGYSLLFDKNSLSIAVKNNENNFIWNSLAEEENDYACILQLEVLYDGKMYSVNTQNNSVAYSLAEYEKTENGIKVNYGFKTDENSEILCNAVVDYSLSGDELCVSCEFENGKKSRILTADLLPCFGSQKKPENEDYFIVPDGSGAVLYTSQSDDVTASVAYAVYGGDASAETENKKCIMPVFCNKTGNNGFSALVCEGDAVCTICAERLKDDIPARLYPKFTVSAYSVDDKKITVADNPQKTVTVKYKFQSGDNIDYSVLAQSVRELLISNEFLSYEKLDYDECKFNTAVIGYSKNGVFDDASVVDFAEVQTVAGLIKGKGIENLNLFCKGFLSGGINQKSILKTRILSVSGGKKGLSELYEYATAENIKLFINVDLVSAGGTGFSLFNTAKSVDGDKATIQRKNPTYISSGESVFQRELVKISKINSCAEKICDITELNSADGICINDAGAFVYSDYSGKGVNAEGYKTGVCSAFVRISSKGSMAVDTGNMYSLKYADIVTDIPMENYISGNGYECIPFMQLILHGYIAYTSQSFNLTDDCEALMLKCIEYGAFPYYEWDFNQNGNIYYGDTIGEAADVYKNISDILNGLSDSVMLSHTELKEGLFKTVYENGAVVYVNYNDNAVSDGNGITVSGKSALRIN